MRNSIIYTAAFAIVITMGAISTAFAEESTSMVQRHSDMMKGGSMNMMEGNKMPMQEMSSMMKNCNEMMQNMNMNMNMNMGKEAHKVQ
jgi:hypothetical protein